MTDAPLVELTPQLFRLTAPNPGVMTGAGTNTYLISAKAKSGGDFIVVDPGPAIDSHIQAIIDITQGNVRSVLVTHTHMDHSPAAAALAAQTGAELLGATSINHALQDSSFLPSRELTHNDIIVLDDYRIRAIHTLSLIHI